MVMTVLLVLALMIRLTREMGWKIDFVRIPDPMLVHQSRFNCFNLNGNSQFTFLAANNCCT